MGAALASVSKPPARRNADLGSIAQAQALRIFASVPPWAIAHAAVDNRSAPLVRQGEVVIVDSDGRKGRIPEDGSLYLIEYVTPPPSPDYGYERRMREIVQVRKTPRGWYAHPYAGTKSSDGVFVMSDGPYDDELALADRILGPVIGVYRPGSWRCAS